MELSTVLFFFFLRMLDNVSICDLMDTCPFGTWEFWFTLLSVDVSTALLLFLWVCDCCSLHYFCWWQWLSFLSLSLSLSLSQNWDGVIGWDRREKGWSITQGWPALPLQLCFIYLLCWLWKLFTGAQLWLVSQQKFRTIL